jgi:RNA polymerase sigma factor (sigma-70 family)
MPATHPAVLLHHIRRLAGGPPAGELSDRELLRRYTARRDEGAFAALVQRHGAMVWRTCRRLLHRNQDAEDVYQATFLVLARKAAGPGWQESIAGWLYAVATRLARKARCDAARRQAPVALPAQLAADPLANISGRELLAALDEELASLPEKYRAPLVLCSLEGRTQEEAARQLRCSLSSVRRRLEDGRGLLHGRLARRGFSLSAALGAVLLARSLASASVPTAMADGTAASAKALALAEWFLKGGSAVSLRFAAACVLIAGVIVSGAGLAGRPAAAPPEPAAPPTKVAEKPQPAPEPAAADDGPLPAGALVRAGTPRLRHGSVVRAIAYSRTGKVLASCGWDAAVRLWDPVSGKELQTIVFRARLWSVAVSPDDQAVASGGQEGVLRLSDVATGRELWAVTDGSGGVQSLAFAPDGKTLASAGQDGTVRLWERATGKELLRMAGHAAEVRSVAFSAAGKTLASGGADGTARLWDPATGKEMANLGGSDRPISAVAFSPDGKSLAAGGADKVIRLWDVAEKKEVRSFEGHAGQVASVAFSPDGKMLASADGYASSDRTVRLWDVATGKEVRRLRGDFWGSVAFAPDGKALAVAPGDAGIHLYDPETGNELPASSGRYMRALGLAASPDGRHVAVVGRELWLLDAATGRELRRFGPPADYTYAAAFAPDGRTLATGGRDGKVRLWDVAGGKEILVMDGHKEQPTNGGWISCLAFSADGRRLAEASRDGTVGLWDPATGTEERRLTGHVGQVWSVAFSPDGKTLLTGGADRTVRLWDVASGQEARRLEGHQEEIEGVAYSPDGRLVASSARDGQVRVWGAASGQPVHVLDEPPTWRQRLYHHHDGRTLAFSPDGRLLASGSWEVVQVWEAATGKERVRFAGHKGEVNALAFLPDGRTLVTGGFDGSAIFWDVTGRRKDGRLAAADLSPSDLETEWAALRGEDGGRAHRAVWALAADPKRALPLLKGQLRPAAAADEKQVARLIAALDDDDFDTREKATQELARLDGAEAALRKALEGNPSAEVRQRVQFALEAREKLELSAEWAVTLRALEVLEQCGTPEAREWLQALAKGAPLASHFLQHAPHLVLWHVGEQRHLAQPPRQHQPQPARHGLLVAAHHLYQLLGRPALRRRRQAEALQQAHLPRRRLPRDQAAALGEPAGADHAGRHRLAVQPQPVAADRLEGVGERVAVVQHRPQPRLLALVLLDDVGLQPARPGDDVPHRLRVAPQHRVGVGLLPGEEVRVEDHAVLDHLGQPAPVLALRQRGQGGRVDPDAGRLVEGADEVLGPRVVDADLAADRRIDHRQERRRHHQQRQAAVERRRHEAGQVADDAAADRHDQRAPVRVEVRQPVVQPRRHRQRLLRLAGRQQFEGGAEASRGQGGSGRLGVRPGVLVADDEGQLALDALPGERPQTGAVVADDGDVVTALAEVDADGGHGFSRWDQAGEHRHLRTDGRHSQARRWGACDHFATPAESGKMVVARGANI